MTMMAAIAEFERDMIHERQREGIAIAKAAGKYIGRKGITIPNIGEYYEKYMSCRGTKVFIASELGISRTTLDKLRINCLESTERNIVRSIIRPRQYCGMSLQKNPD